MERLGTLPAPYSGTNDTSHGGSGNNIEMYGPSQVTVDNGLTLTAQRNTNQWASTYPWISGVVTTEGKFSLPTGGWFVQVKAKMPDTSQGMWPAIWFLPGTSGTASNEFDGFEGGWLGSSPNTQGHSDYFANQGQRQSVWASGTDITAGYHVYGYQFIPGQSITAYLDGNRVWQVHASSGITITGEPYEIMLELQVAGSPTSGWHTITNANTPASSMQVAEVQAYSGSSARSSPGRRKGAHCDGGRRDRPTPVLLVALSPQTHLVEVEVDHLCDLAIGSSLRCHQHDPRPFGDTRFDGARTCPRLGRGCTNLRPCQQARKWARW